jgi:RNA polymerase sigma factor (TIGR02999 family)
MVRGGGVRTEPEHFDPETVLGLLRTVAEEQMAGERRGHTLQPTAIVHEVWLRAMSGNPPSFASEAKFRAWASTVVRHVLVDHARARAAAKRSNGLRRSPAEPSSLPAPSTPEHLVAVHDALERLGAAHPRQARVVELMFFGGMTRAEVAEELGLSVRTVAADWELARAMLFRMIQEENGVEPSRAGLGGD